MLYVKRKGNLHSIRELEVSTKLKLNNTKDYITGEWVSGVIIIVLDDRLLIIIQSIVTASIQIAIEFQCDLLTQLYQINFIRSEQPN